MTSPYLRQEAEFKENEPETLKSIMVESYENCSFCGSKLVFSHDLNFGFLQVIEVARCSGCGVTMNPKKFTLQ
jgi:DNA-directed RNA polymerase subunit RPC12/RpoP